MQSFLLLDIFPEESYGERKREKKEEEWTPDESTWYVTKPLQ